MASSRPGNFLSPRSTLTPLCPARDSHSSKFPHAETQTDPYLSIDRSINHFTRNKPFFSPNQVSNLVHIRANLSCNPPKRDRFRSVSCPDFDHSWSSFLFCWIGSLLKENVLQWRSFVEEESRFGRTELEREGSPEGAGAGSSRAEAAIRVTAEEFCRAQDPG